MTIHVRKKNEYCFSNVYDRILQLQLCHNYNYNYTSNDELLERFFICEMLSGNMV